MKIEEIQIALFAAYDIRNAMSSADRRKPTENDSFGESLDTIIGTLERVEQQFQGESK
jgi:hypothetical protein